MESASASLAGGHARATVLLAEDDPLVRALTGRLLLKSGFEVIAVQDGQEALDAFGAEPAAFACALLDQSMPRLDGIDALRAMRKIRADMPAVIASGYVSQELAAELGGDSRVRLVQKPCTFASLVQLLGELVPSGEPEAVPGAAGQNIRVSPP